MIVNKQLQRMWKKKLFQDTSSTFTYENWRKTQKYSTWITQWTQNQTQNFHKQKAGVKELHYLYPRQWKGTSAYHLNIMQHAVITSSDPEYFLYL